MKVVRYFFFVLLTVLSCNVWAQTKSKKPVTKSTVQKSTVKKTTSGTKPKTTQSSSSKPLDADQADKRVRDMVAFFQYMLNMLASGSTNARDKDVLITQSYSKIFFDSNVQIEDDLDEERETITNKKVMAYLKDVDFFFANAKFEFTIDRIEQGTHENGKSFYKVTTSRNLQGTLSDGKLVNSNAPRFIEINYNPGDQDLKIASIYTHAVDEKEALISWWKELSYEWQSIFKSRLHIIDSVSVSNLREITSLDSLDLSNNKFIRDIEPLARLVNIRSINLSHTSISDLTPIRNLSELTKLNLSYTPVQNVAVLRYANKLENFNLQHTFVQDISVVAQMPQLRHVNFSETSVKDFSAMLGLTQLTFVNLRKTSFVDLSVFENLSQLDKLIISNTSAVDLRPIQSLKKITVLNIDSTKVGNIAPLSGLDNLKILSANHTLLVDLQPLKNLANLEKVYCDQSAINKAIAEKFMATNPKVLVIYNSGDMNTWWTSLAPDWQDVLSKAAKINPTPSKEELATLNSIDSINVSGNGRISNLEALRPLQKIRVIYANNTSITDLAPLRDHTEIVYLNINETDVADLSVAQKFTKLKELHADKTKIQSIEPLNKLTNLKKLYVDQTAIHDITAQEFLEQNPHCLLVFKTIHLNRWWRGLSSDWKKAIRSQMGTDTTATRENLHKLVELESFQVDRTPITDFAGLAEFVRLKKFSFSGTSIVEIPTIENLRSLKSLHATNSPLMMIDALAQWSDLEELDISNTPIDDLRIIGLLKNLKSFNCAGTQVKRLNSLELLGNLQFLDCSNTGVSKLDPLYRHSLKTLKCYNTKVTSREVENFKISNPECEVVYYR